MKEFKSRVSRLLGDAIDFLVDIHEKISDDEILQNDQNVTSSWSVYVLNTKTHVAVVAARDGVGDMIPDDGSFINGILVDSGLTESAAKVRVSEIGKNFGVSEERDEQLS